MMVWGVIYFPKPPFAPEQYCLVRWGQQTYERVLGADATAKVTALSFFSAGSVLVILGLDLGGNVT